MSSNRVIMMPILAMLVLAMAAAPSLADPQPFILSSNLQCPRGYIPATYEAIKNDKATACTVVTAAEGEWAIVRIAGGGSMDGSGYGCGYRRTDTRGMGRMLCMPGVAPTSPPYVPVEGNPEIRGYNHVGCFNDAKPIKGLPVTFDMVHALRAIPAKAWQEEMTVESCAAFAASQNSFIFGVEYGKECWYVPSGAERVTTVEDAQKYGASEKCTMSCAGSPAQLCGGKWAFNLYAAVVADKK